MVVRIRLARFGKRNAPFYNIVVAKDRTARNSKPIEVLGTYDPIPKPPPLGVGLPYKDIQLDTARAKYWLGVGAQPSDPVWRLLTMLGLLEPKPHVAKMREAAKRLANSAGNVAEGGDKLEDASGGVSGGSGKASEGLIN